MKVVIFGFLLIFSITLPVFALFQQIEGIEEEHIKRVAISSINPKLMYVASKNALFRSEDDGRSFKKIYTFIDEEITCIFFSPLMADTIYLSTTTHLYKITKDKERIFTSSEEIKIFAIAKHKDDIYLGTSKGLYFAKEDTLNWQTHKSLSDTSIYSIDTDGEKLYLATSKGVYYGDKDSFKRILVLREPEDTGEEITGLVANIIKVDLFDNSRLWLGTSKGLYSSDKKRKSWRKLYIGGIDNVAVYSIAQTKLEKNSLYLGTSGGFFRVDTGKKIAQSLYEGIYDKEILWVEISPKGEVYLATSKGLFKGEYFKASLKSNIFKEVFGNEPSIEEVQRIALRYNEVHPEKIKKWRNFVKFRGLFPTLKLDYDKTIDIYQTSTVSRVVRGPRDWGLSLSWDIADLIWNPYEDDIDTRSRLNTQLRLDILDEINRVYFERLRLRREILSSVFSEEELFQKELRLRELTAILDGYTGGYFSRKTKMIKKEQNE